MALAKPLKEAQGWHGGFSAGSPRLVARKQDSLLAMFWAYSQSWPTFRPHLCGH